MPHAHFTQSTDRVSSRLLVRLPRRGRAREECIGTPGVHRERFPLSAIRRIVAVALSISLVAPASALAAPKDRVDGFTASELKVPAAAMPQVGMRAGVLATEDGRILWARNDDARRAMASITKIMTAVVALERSDLDSIVTVPASAKTVGESTSFLRVGEKLPLSELLEALLVKSGNDAAITIANHVAGDEPRFVRMMNAKAVELGLDNTHYVNSHGLDQRGQYSSAEDLAVLARYAMSKPEFRKIVSEKYAFVDRTTGDPQRIENTNLLLGNYAGAVGVKTGWTSDAGYSVIAAAKRGSTLLYAVVLGTPSENQRFVQARDLLDWGFAHFREQKVSSAGTVLGEAVVEDYLDMTVPAEVSKDTSVTVLDLAGPIDRSVTVSAVRAPVSKGDKLGVVTYTQRGRVLASVPLVSVKDVKKPNVFQRIGIAIVRAWRRFTGGPNAAALPQGASAGVSILSTRRLHT